MPELEETIYACLLGGLIGDAMGAPGEGKTFGQIQEQFGPEGIIDFEGDGTDDTAIREQLLHAILTHGGHVSCDEFAESFSTFRSANYGKWWVPVRNMFHKVDSRIALPADAGYGNAPSSSSAMAISPMGIVNAGHPRQAALETFDVASLLHSGPSGFCRDAACAMAAAIAEALRPDASVESVISAATRYLHPVSAREMIGCIEAFQNVMQATGDYESFRAVVYEKHLREEQCDSRETVPIALALFALEDGEAGRAIVQGANFGRDADTIATMVGGLCGAFRGLDSLPARWVKKVEANPHKNYRAVASELAEIVRQRAEAAITWAQMIETHLLTQPKP